MLCVCYQAIAFRHEALSVNMLYAVTESINYMLTHSYCMYFSLEGIDVKEIKSVDEILQN